VAASKAKTDNLSTNAAKLEVCAKGVSGATNKLLDVVKGGVMVEVKADEAKAGFGNFKKQLEAQEHVAKLEKALTDQRKKLGDIRVAEYSAQKAPTSTPRK
jgi:hypothetical protein